MDSLGVDLISTQPFLPQYKMGRNYRNPKLIEEVNTEELQGVPTLHLRADRKEEVVCMYGKDFFNLVAFAKEQAEMHGIDLQEIFSPTKYVDT